MLSPLLASQVAPVLYFLLSLHGVSAHFLLLFFKDTRRRVHPSQHSTILHSYVCNCLFLNKALMFWEGHELGGTMFTLTEGSLII
jgi:hypothetical protein